MLHLHRQSRVGGEGVSSGSSFVLERWSPGRRTTKIMMVSFGIRLDFALFYRGLIVVFESEVVEWT